MKPWRGTSLHFFRAYAKRAPPTPLRQIPRLHTADLDVFRETAFTPETLILFPKGQFAQFPAISKWFMVGTNGQQRLDTSYLQRHGKTLVPLEYSQHDGGVTSFTRQEQPLSHFLSTVDGREQELANSEDKIQAERVYLAQCSLSTLPPELRADLPAPGFVTRAGRGDVYESSIWLGHAPTFTPLHKDPNPNLFIQLAGAKTIRIFEPLVGRGLFALSQKKTSGSRTSEYMRGEEMMYGEERRVLEELVWAPKSLVQAKGLGYEATVEAGDGLFIPKGWWHSVRSEGHGFIGSVNWWFR